MIIKEVIIENFLCYYDVKTFHFSSGLNVILGENGEGKTKFFEALEFLFQYNPQKSEQFVSAKKLAEIVSGESFRVAVTLTTEQSDGYTKTVSRQFTVTKKEEGNFECSRVSLEGIVQSPNGERELVDGTNLLEQIFPSTIRRYSMFKGESSLNIFDEKDALIILINTFSDARYYDKYKDKGTYLQSEAEKAVDANTRLATKNKAEYDRLEANIKRLEGDLAKARTHLNATKDQIEKTQLNIEDAESYVSNAEALETVNKRIADSDSKIQAAQSRIDEDFTMSLLDKKWILLGYEAVHKEFAQKINALSIEKRKLQSKYDTEIGIKIGEEKARIKMLNDAIPLPITVPSRAVMEEMLQDELCKVCNRPAPKESEAYEFMLKRLEEYLRSQQPEKEIEVEIEPLFKHDYTSKLLTMSATHEDSLAAVRSIRQTIQDLFEFNEARRAEVNRFTALREKEIEERERILGSSDKGETSLNNVMKNYKYWQRSLVDLLRKEKDYENDIANIGAELKGIREKKDAIDTENANNFLIKTRDILRDVCTIFTQTRERKFSEFIRLLQTKSNDFFQKINVNAFTGEIIFTYRSSQQKVDIELQENGRKLHRPNQSLLTSMHLAILFAISELASERHEEGYPMIFDAPTSSFGETKTAAFLNILSNSSNQIILLLKDFIVQNKATNSLEIKPEFNNVRRSKAMMVKLERPFDSKDLTTINSQVINL